MTSAWKWLEAKWRAADTPHHVFIYFVAGLAVVLLFLASCRLPSTHVTGRLVAQTVSFDVAQSLNAVVAVDFDPPEAQLSSFTSAQPLSLPSGTAVSGLRVMAGKLRLVELHVVRGGSLELSLSPGPRRRLRILVGGGGGFMLDAPAPVSLRMNGANPQTFGPPDPGPIIAEADRMQPVPLRLEATLPVPPTPVEQLPAQATGSLTEVLDGASVAALRFGRPGDVTSDRPFVSSISGGQLTVVNTEEQIALDPGSPLSLAGFRGYVISVGLGADGFHVSFTGKADQVKTGPIGFADNRTPTLLEAAYHVQWVKLVCTTALGMATALATVLVPSRRQKTDP